MTDAIAMNPELDLVLEREVDVPPELVWAAWTTPEHIKQWFTPKPWRTVDCEIELRPGGRFYTVMASPDGEEYPSEGCYLEVVENQRLVWTSAMLPGYRPADTGDNFPFTAVITLEPTSAGTRYRAVALHRDAEARKQHEEMGFVDGWGAALDQLVELAKTL